MPLTVYNSFRRKRIFFSYSFSFGKLKKVVEKCSSGSALLHSTWRKTVVKLIYVETHLCFIIIYYVHTIQVPCLKTGLWIQLVRPNYNNSHQQLEHCFSLQCLFAFLFEESAVNGFGFFTFTKKFSAKKTNDQKTSGDFNYLSMICHWVSFAIF